MWARENDFDDLIAAAANSYGVPVWVIKATAAKESSFDPTAYDGSSRGLMMIEEATARGLGYTGTIGDDTTRTGGLYDPTIAIRFGVKDLGQLQTRYPSEPWDARYAAYNSGKIRRNAAGEFVNSKGLNIVEQHVAGWRRAADYFMPGWRDASPGG